jgi:phosphoribosylglycinamide formyltransferase-1
VPAINLGVLCSGRGSNLEAILESCEQGRIGGRVVVVISDVADAFALERARRHGVEALYLPPGKFRTKLEPEIEEQYLRALRERGVDLVCLAGFMRVLKSTFIQAFPQRILNIHPALLPAFPGLHAQQQAFDHGVKIAGCTVHFVDEGIDAGPIIMQAAVPVMENDTEATLAARILEQEHIIYSEAIQLFAEGRLRIEGRRVRILPPGQSASSAL